MLMRQPRCLAYVTNEIAIYYRRKHGRMRMFIPAHSFDFDVNSPQRYYGNGTLVLLIIEFITMSLQEVSLCGKAMQIYFL